MLPLSNMIRSLCLLVGLALFPSSLNLAQPFQVQTYTTDESLFANPERGFFIQRAPIYLDASRQPVADEGLDSYRAEGISLVRLLYMLDQYRESPLDAEFFVQFQADMDAVRAAGMKAIIRFAYNSPTNDDYEESRDAALEWVLAHIEQLKPVLTANVGIIAHLDAGFIGAWGEWHSSSNGLIDTPTRGVNDATRAIVDALLDALPPTRMVALRYPLLKQQLFGDNPLDAALAFSGVPQSRLGALDDCFLASASNWGTYLDVDSQEQIEPLKDYLNADNRYVVQSGETCNFAEDAQPFVQCENALADLQRMHWSSLNIDYHEDVLNLWREQGCFDEIFRRLGYRLVLQEASISTPVQAGAVMALSMTLVNEGFASPYNPRGFDLYLRDVEGTVYPLQIDNPPNPRFWLAGETITLALQVTIPSDLAAGDYEVLLHLPDPEPDLSADPRYALRLANEGLWENETGYHRLGLHITL